MLTYNGITYVNVRQICNRNYYFSIKHLSSTPGKLSVAAQEEVCWLQLCSLLNSLFNILVLSNLFPPKYTLDGLRMQSLDFKEISLLSVYGWRPCKPWHVVDCYPGRITLMCSFQSCSNWKLCLWQISNNIQHLLC